jgi:hypothetical protein
MRRPEIKDAVVVARVDASGEPFLPLCVTGQPGSLFDVDALAAALDASLPEIMLPRTIITVCRFPLTPNASVDRRRCRIRPRLHRFKKQIAARKIRSSNDFRRSGRRCSGSEKVGVPGQLSDLGGHSPLSVVQVQRWLQDATGRNPS